MEKNIKELAALFKALSDPTRLKMVMLIKTYQNNLCVGILAQKMGITQPAVSQHLKILKNAGLVEADRIGYHIHYSVNNEALDRLGIRVNEVISKLSVDCEMKDQCKTNSDAINCIEEEA